MEKRDIRELQADLKAKYDIDIGPKDLQDIVDYLVEFLRDLTAPEYHPEEKE